MEPNTQTTQPLPNVSVLPSDSSHKKAYVVVGVVVGALIVIGAFVGMYMWQESTHTAVVNDLSSQKTLVEQQAVALKEEVDKEKLNKENLLQELFKSMIASKYGTSATSTITINVIQKTEAGDAYKIGVGINCKEGGTEEENQGCSGIEKFYKRKDGTWMIVGFNDICPVDAESEALCARAGF